MMQMKDIRRGLFIRIWGVHILVYYFIYGNIDNFLRIYYMKWTFFDDESLMRSFLSPFFGFVGWFDNFPLFFLFPLIGMGFLVFKWNKKWFLSYSITSIVSYVMSYMYGVYDGKGTLVYMSRIFEDGRLELPKLAVIIPSLSLAILLNWLIFKKQYEHIEVNKIDQVKDR